MIKFVYEQEEIHQPFSGVRRVEFSVGDEQDLSSMLEAYEQFLRAIGYHIDGEIDVVKDDDLGDIQNDVLVNNVSQSVRQQDAMRVIFSNMEQSRDVLP